MYPFALLHRSVQKTPYVWVCFAMIVGVMGTALASPLYPLYQQTWQLSTGDITVLYVVYMCSALSSLLFLGRISDQKGFIVVLRGGLIVVTLGVFLSAIAWSYWSFLFSRIIIGLASSMIVTSASLGLNQLNRSKDLQRAAATTSLLVAFGFGLGPVIGGSIAQWSSLPLRTSYIPSVIMGLIAICALFMLPKQPAPLKNKKKQKARWYPTVFIPNAEAKSPFLLGATAAFTSFAMFSLFASLAPSFMRDMVPWHGPIVSGFSIGIILFLSAGFQLLVRAWPLKRSLSIGFISFALSNLLLMANLQYTSAILFITALLLVALGHGLCLISGMGIVNRVTPAEHRSAATSSYLIIAYLGAILPILGIGFLADTFGMQWALIGFLSCLFILNLGLFYLTLRKISLPT